MAKQCFKNLKTITNRVNQMNVQERVLVKIFFALLLPRETGTDQLSWDHRHFIYFLSTRKPLNLSTYIFHHLCESINETKKFKNPSNKISHPRLLSYRFSQLAIPERFQAAQVFEDIEEVRAPFLDAKIQLHIRLKNSNNLLYPQNPLL
jgi:hypothetical protein